MLRLEQFEGISTFGRVEGQIFNPLTYVVTLKALNITLLRFKGIREKKDSCMNVISYNPISLSDNKESINPVIQRYQSTSHIFFNLIDAGSIVYTLSGGLASSTKLDVALS